MCFSYQLIVVYRVWCFFFKQKTAYEMRISDWSSDVCSSDLDILNISPMVTVGHTPRFVKNYMADAADIESAIRNYVSEVKSGAYPAQIGRASCRESVCQYV